MTKYQIQEKAASTQIAKRMDCDHDSFLLPWMYRAQTPCNTVISQGEHLESNPQAHSWMMELLSVSTQGRWNLRAKKKWYVTSSRTHIKGSKSYQMNRVRERKRARQTQCSRKMGQIAWTLILRDQNIPLGFEGDGASMCVPGSMHATKWWGRLTSLQNACCAQLLHEVPTTLT